MKKQLAEKDQAIAQMRGMMDKSDSRMLVIPQGTTQVQKDQFNTAYIEVVVVPSSVTEIGARAFANCASLREVVFTADSRLKAIGVCAFYNSGITSFTAPASLRVIC